MMTSTAVTNNENNGLRAFASLLGPLLVAGSAKAQVVVPEVQRLDPESWVGSTSFGESVAVDRDHVVLGNPSGYTPNSLDRPVEIYERGGAGWSKRQVEVPSQFVIADGLGVSVAVEGNWVVAGAPFGDAVGVFQRTLAGDWVLFARIDNPTPAPMDPWGGFGWACVPRGDRLVVAAPGYDDHGFINEGRVHVFQFTGVTWQLEQTLTPASPAPLHGFFFGASVDFDGATIAVCSSYLTRGAVTLFARDPSGSWVITDILQDPAPEFVSGFACSVAIDGDTLVVGKRRDHQAIPGRQGRAIIFERQPAGGWTSVAELRASNGIGDDEFGANVEIEGDVILVAAPDARAPGTTSPRGQCYVFRRRADGTWPSTEDERLVPSDSASFGFGYDIALCDGFAAIGDERNHPTAAFVFAVGPESDLCLPLAGSGAVACRLDAFGSSVAGSNAQGVTLSHAEPLTRFVLVGSTTASAAGPGTTIGGMPLCLTGSLARIAHGQVATGASVDFVEPGTWNAGGAALFSVVGTLYLQALVAEPPPTARLGFTNAIAWTLR